MIKQVRFNVPEAHNSTQPKLNIPGSSSSLPSSIFKTSESKNRAIHNTDHSLKDALHLDELTKYIHSTFTEIVYHLYVKYFFQ